jgi:hypothetical protein
VRTYTTEQRENGHRCSHRTHRQSRRRRNMNTDDFKTGETKIILPLVMERKSRLYFNQKTLLSFVENT